MVVEVHSRPSCLPTPMMQNIMLWRIPFRKMWRPDDHCAYALKRARHWRAGLTLTLWRPDDHTQHFAENNVQFVQVAHPDCSMARSKKGNRRNDPVKETKPNCKTNLLVTKNHHHHHHFFPAPLFQPHEGPMVQGCSSGQPPGTNCFYTSHSPNESPRPDIPLPGWEANGGHRGRCRTGNGWK